MTIVNVIVLIYAVRNYKSSSVVLLSPVYITGYKSECNRAPDYKVRAGSTMQSGFIFYIPSKKSNGVLMYKLQREQAYVPTKLDKDTNDAYLLVVWDISRSEKLYADVLLEKYDLKDLYYRNVGQFRPFSDVATETWSLDDHLALATTSTIINDKYNVLDITIYEARRDHGRGCQHILIRKGE
jgi:hypothetical protein